MRYYAEAYYDDKYNRPNELAYYNYKQSNDNYFSCNLVDVG